ncbi:unnamed protein product [Gulo gulo]|uniref:Uncharacterized protein n=1 Tax=Gulo gulo TaxID=48420 RepID=A0A9X9PSU0_GULGU|nr:unnamed protein product [Gulo gulo]
MGSHLDSSFCGGFLNKGQRKSVKQARAMGHVAVPTAPSRGLTEHARSHAAMQPEERWDGVGQRMHRCGWVLGNTRTFD